MLNAAAQNLKRFLAARGWGQRLAPCGSLVALKKGAADTARPSTDDQETDRDRAL
jgi:hypothetical protein